MEHIHSRFKAILPPLVLLLLPPDRFAIGFTATPDGMLYGFGGGGNCGASGVEGRPGAAGEMCGDDGAAGAH